MYVCKEIINEIENSKKHFIKRDRRTPENIIFRDGCSCSVDTIVRNVQQVFCFVYISMLYLPLKKNLC